MKRIVVSQYGGPEKLVLQDSPAQKPDPGQVLVHLQAAGVNPVDGYRRAGSHGYNPPLPFTPGFEGAGVVADLGDGVTGLEVGQSVYVGWSVTGTYGQWCLAASHRVFPLPSGLSMEQAAGLFVPYFTAYRALVHRGQFRKGDKILIHGASGSVGLAAIQWCVFLGLVPWGTAGSSHGVQRVLNAGAVGCEDHGETDYLNKLKEQSGGFDGILEMNAHLNLDKDLDVLTVGGRVVVIGSKGEVSLNPRKTMGIEADIRGMVLMKADEGELEETHLALVQGVSRGVIRPWVGKVLPIKQAPQAHELMDRSPSEGKIILSTEI